MDILMWYWVSIGFLVFCYLNYSSKKLGRMVENLEEREIDLEAQIRLLHAKLEANGEEHVETW